MSVALLHVHRVYCGIIFIRGGRGGVNVRGQPNVISSVNSLVCSTTIGLTGIFATV